VFGMELSKHGCNAASGDWFGATSTQWSSLGMIMSLAVGQTFMIEEWTAVEWLTAILKEIIKETFIWAPSFDGFLIYEEFWEGFYFRCVGVGFEVKFWNLKQKWFISLNFRDRPITATSKIKIPIKLKIN
jgi:hypothetical protein